jgi:hypothetical protein
MANCHQLKMKAADGKQRLTDVADTEQLFSIIQISSKKGMKWIHAVIGII